MWPRSSIVKGTSHSRRTGLPGGLAGGGPRIREGCCLASPNSRRPGTVPEPSRGDALLGGESDAAFGKEGRRDSGSPGAAAGAAIPACTAAVAENAGVAV